MAKRIYLDHAATTPLLPTAMEAMTAELGRWANPSSPHAEGRAARKRLEDARAEIENALGWPGELIFTSGASEAIQIALGRAHAGKRLICPIEHDAVLRAAEGAPRLALAADGLVDLSALEKQLADDGAGTLIAVQQVNNETGLIQPVEQIAALARQYDALFFCDASQSAGKLPIPDADMVAVSAHKLGGPPGIGALLIRELGQLAPSGGQEKGYRGGTENLPATAGFAAALASGTEWLTNALRLRAKLEEGARCFGLHIINEASPRIATIGAYRLAGMKSSAQLIRFDMAGISVSAGSACSSGTLKPSHVLMAMELSAQEAEETIRISFGPQTTESDIDSVLALWQDIAR